MDKEFGSKLARVADEFVSNESLLFPRDQADLLFQTTEIDTLFILTVYLEGYMRGNIKVDIEEGNKMVVTCEKPVQETLMIGTKVIKNGVAIRKLTKAFDIPVGVILDQIKTYFNEQTSVLTITMPKRVKGILGTRIQEVKEPELVTQTSSEYLPKRETFQGDKGAKFSSAGTESGYQKEQVSGEAEMQFPGFPSYFPKAHDVVEKLRATDGVPLRETEKPKVEPKSQEIDDSFQEKRAHSNEIGAGKVERTYLKDQPKDGKVCEKANGIKEEKTGDDLSRTKEEDKLPEGRSRICLPVIAGSAVILSLVVFVIHFTRKKNQAGKRKE